MGNRILIAYATRTGSTAEVAKVISQVLTARGFTPTLKLVKEKTSIEGYNAVVLGSPIRMGVWLPEMLEFIGSNQAELNRIPTALFTVHILNAGNDDASRAARKAYTDPLRKMITPVDEAFFAGAIDFDKLSFLNRARTRLMVGDSGLKIGDFREWDKVRAWAKDISI